MGAQSTLAMAFEVTFEDESLEELERNPKDNAGYDRAIVKAFRKRMQMIRSAIDERDFREMRSVRFEKLKGNRSHQHSMRLNDQWRLILEVGGEKQNKKIRIVGIEDYH